MAAAGRHGERSVGKTVLGWLVGSAVGSAVIALPDPDDRVFSFSRTHGPSPLDLVGTVVLVASWLPVAALLWRRRRRLRGPTALAAGLLALAGAAFLVVTIGLDLGPIYLGAVALLVTAQLLALRVVATRTAGP